MSRGDPTYWRVSPKFWRHAQQYEWSDDARQLALYLLTCAHRTTEGIYCLPVGYMATDLAWVESRVVATLAQLLQHGFAQYDDKTCVVFIPKAMKYQRPDNPNGRTSVVRRVAELPKTPLLAAFIDSVDKYSTTLAQRLCNELPTLYTTITYPTAIATATTTATAIKDSLSDSCESSAASPKVLAPSQSDWQARADSLLAESHFPTELERLAEIMAGKNQTGKAALSRIVNKLYEPLVALQSEVSDEALRHGLRAAISAEAPNCNYVKKAALNYNAPRVAGNSAAAELADYDHDFLTG